MKNERVPQRKRLVKSRLSDTSLMATEAIVSLFRAGARAKEILSLGREKERLHAFRFQMERVDRYKEAALKNVDLSPEAMFDEVDSVFWNALPYEEYQRHQSWLGEQKARLAQHRAAQNLYVSHKDDQQNVVGVMEEYAQQHPSDPDAWVWLGIAQRNTGNLIEAIKAQQRAIELTEDKLPHALKQRTLADWLHESGQTEEAINLLHEVIRTFPEDTATEAVLSFTYFALGKVLWEIGEQENAKLAWKEMEIWNDNSILKNQVAEYLKN